MEVEGVILKDLRSNVFNFEVLPMEEGQRRRRVDVGGPWHRWEEASGIDKR